MKKDEYNGLFYKQEYENLVLKAFENRKKFYNDEFSPYCLFNLGTLLNKLSNLEVKINFINPTDNGMMVEFPFNNKYYVFELMNDNGIILLVRNGNDREIIDNLENIFQYLELL